MRVSRIHTNQSLAADSEVMLDGQTAHYLGKVLRLSAGAQVTLFNGNGHEYSATVAHMDRKACSVRIDGMVTPATESALHTVLGLGVSRGERMDYAIQKSTELGVTEIVPLFTEHCEVRLDAERQQKRLEHWRQVAISACEQSGRVKVPVIRAITTLATWVQSSPAELCLLFDPDQDSHLPASRPAAGVALLTGPEGGLSADEINAAHRGGFVGIALGPRILRTETAPVAALAVLQYLWG